MNYELEITDTNGIVLKVCRTTYIYGGRTLQFFRRNVRADLVEDLYCSDVDDETISEVVNHIETLLPNGE